jgi:cyclopropane fatty-acyl-phospholipid synthase-like methyltransferase
MASEERFGFAIDQLDLRPDHRVLEVGCGHGVAASSIAARLDAGSYVGIDRSPKMIAAARRRLASELAAGRAELHCATFAEAALDSRRFDRIFAARVVAMTRETELRLAAELLDAGGMLVLAFDAPGQEPSRDLIDATIANLATVGFGEPELTRYEGEAQVVVCVRAVRGRATDR